MEQFDIFNIIYNRTFKKPINVRRLIEEIIVEVEKKRLIIRFALVITPPRLTRHWGLFDALKFCDIMNKRFLMLFIKSS